MYQWWTAQEQADLWREENRALTSFERERLELLEELDAESPSLFQRVISVFKAEPEGPEPLFPRTAVEAELLGPTVTLTERR